MSGRKIDRLPGMRDRAGDPFVRFAGLRDAVLAHLSEAGYEPIDTPLLEDAELFVRKSGGELASRLYTFVDPGGNQVGLRPEFTPSVIRSFIRERDRLTLPVRWRYAGPVFRYEPNGADSYRQYTQVGVEVVGGAGPEFDAEVIDLAWKGLAGLGLAAELRIGHLRVVQSLLGAFSLPEAAKMFVVGNLPALKDADTDVSAVMERAETLGLVQREGSEDGPTGLEAASREDARSLVQAVLRDSLSGSVGRRTPEQIVARLLRKVESSNGAADLEGSLTLASDLARLEGPGRSVLSEARSIANRRGIPADTLDDLASLLDTLYGRGIPEDRIVVDLGLARGFAYYTGAVFELIDPGSSLPLGGGGRYDGLVRTLGADEDVSALGFAYNLDRVLDVLDGTARS